MNQSVKPVDKAYIEENMGIFERIAINAMDNEYLRLSLRDRVSNPDSDYRHSSELVEWFFKQYERTDLHLFFTKRAVEEMIDNVFSHVERTRFVLNITERVVLKMTHTLPDGVSLEDKIIQTARLLASSRVEKDSVLPSGVIQTYTEDTIYFRDLLTGNLWLFVLYLIISNFQYSIAMANHAVTIPAKKTKQKAAQNG